MKNVFIIHGAFGYPDENWFGWMKNKINKLGYEVYVPQLPTPEGQSLGNWLKVFEKYENKINNCTKLRNNEGVVSWLYISVNRQK